MNDLIDRQEAQPGQKDFEKQLHDMFDHIWDCEIDHPAFQDTVGELMEAAIQAHNNSAQPERKRGQWIEANTHTYGIYECTACKAWTYIPNEPRDYNFCPRCGADMRRTEDASD